jgi:hypothetical protein
LDGVYLRYTTYPFFFLPNVGSTPHLLAFIFNSFNICPFCQTTEKLKEIKTAKDKAMHKGDTKAKNK